MNEKSTGMAETMQNQGKWLFHRRSLAGLALLPALVWALWQPGFPASAFSQQGMQRLGLAGFGISLIGLALRWIIAARVPANTSRRSNRILQAQSLNQSGMYSIVRHPLYLANALAASGFVLAIGSLWFFVVFQLAHALYIERVMACEDRFLETTHGDSWRRWATRTPAFFPKPWLWKPDALACSVRTTLRREYNGVFVVTGSFAILSAARGLIFHHEALRTWASQQWFWCLVAIFGLSTLVLLRTLKRHTRLLHVPGR